MGDVNLLVNGRRYGGWESVRVTRSIETFAGGFQLQVSDRWADQQEPWPIAEEDACRVELDGHLVVDGFVGRRSQALSTTQRTLTLSGKDRTAALVECSAVLDQWSFRNASVFDVASKVAAPFGVSVHMQAGLELPTPPRKLAVNPGETAYHVIERAAQAAGVLVVSDGAGGLLITRAGTGRAAPIVEGLNLLSGSVDYNGEERFHRYVVASQVAGTDNAAAGATRVRAEAADENVRRTDRVLLVRPESGVTANYARQRADWEARIRAARSETVSVTLQGWTQPGGALWPINALVSVKSPGLGVDGELLISQIEYSLGPGGETTRLRLVRPDAFTPEPTAVVKRSGKGSAWKELAGGAGR